MYFFIEQSNNLRKRAEQFNLDYNDIYVSAMQSIQEEYSLPSLHEWGDGYCQGDASIDELVELKNTIHRIEDSSDPVVYFEIDEEDETNFHTDIFEYLDKKLIQKLEDSVESQIKQFGDEEFTKTQFDEYKEKAEKVIKEHLNKEYYQSGDAIGQDYSVYLLADKIEAFEHIEASSNWMFQHSNEARFCIVHLNNYDKAFDDFSDLISEESYIITSDNLQVEDSVVLAYMLENDIDVEDDNIKDAYKEMSYDEKIDMWKEIASDGIESYDDFARGEAIDSIIEAIDWNEIETWFNAQFEEEA